MNSIEIIQEEINKLDNIDNWNDKITNIKKIKEQIVTEEENINGLIEELNKPKIKNNINIDKLINDFNGTNDIKLKIKNYQFMLGYINQLNEELFSTI
jgi:hypothetical protein